MGNGNRGLLLLSPVVRAAPISEYTSAGKRCSLLTNQRSRETAMYDGKSYKQMEIEQTKKGKNLVFIIYFGQCRQHSP